VASAFSTMMVDAEGNPYDDPISVAVLGRPNVGKSTLINTLLGDALGPDQKLLTGPTAGITRDMKPMEWLWRKRRFCVIDTAGVRRNARRATEVEQLSCKESVLAMRRSHVSMVVLDATEPLMRQDKRLIGEAVSEGRALVIVVNKWDLINERARKSLEKEIDGFIEGVFARARGVPVVYMSALKPRGHYLDALSDAIVTVNKRWNKLIPRRHQRDFFKDFIAFYPAPRIAHGKKAKIGMVFQLKARPPTFKVVSSDKLPVAYVRCIEKHLRKTFDLGGVPIRLEHK